ncbi:hypothetical protein F4813DRAFT_370591 [Daldinia decipiens]|uniref:uncharacterized protein n=1 Tax=Daldinia decipiens TaxID=326647 RepID=UPI0020C44C4B|nr:uncharacterized protein F4813DRAFT_370591 [Daldinia decipiens]KAI1654622.1 hypothetical protein F4813DRAFT_370591 [Daldinia decipiens]
MHRLVLCSCVTAIVIGYVGFVQKSWQSSMEPVDRSGNTAFVGGESSVPQLGRFIQTPLITVTRLKKHFQYASRGKSPKTLCCL